MLRGFHAKLQFLFEFLSLNRRGNFAGKFSSVQHVQQEPLNRTRLTHMNQGLHICGTEIIAILIFTICYILYAIILCYIYGKNDTDLWKNKHAIKSLVLSITTVLQCASLYCLYFISFLMFWQGKTNIFPHFKSKTFCHVQTSPVPLVEWRRGKPLSLYC